MTTTPSDDRSLPLDEATLDRLLSALADGMLEEAGRARLERALEESAWARQRYLEFMRLEFLLASEIGFVAASAETDDALAAERGADSSGEEDTSAVRPGSRGRWFMAPAAATVLISLIGATSLALALWPRAGRPAVRVTATRHAVWEAGRETAVGEPLAGGPVRLLQGTAQLTFASGAVVAVHAPAAIEVLGDNRLFVRSGRVTPYVPPAAKGFTVVSPSGEVIDYGTEFSIDVGADGKTDVFVIDGEVGVAGGHGSGGKPVRLTQGFAGRFTAMEHWPAVTLRPLVIDHFSAQAGPLRRRDWQAEEPSIVSEGRLWLPIDGRPHRPEPAVHTILDHDFSSIVGRRSVVSFKAWLPKIGTAHHGRWVAFVIDDGGGDPPRATSPAANFGIMLSPQWRVGMRVAGEGVRGLPSDVFERGGNGFGPYQVVVAIDDSPEARANHGHAVVTAVVNGLEFVRDYPLSLPPQPRFSLHTFVHRLSGGTSFALIDDFSVSVDVAADADSAPGED